MTDIKTNQDILQKIANPLESSLIQSALRIERRFKEANMEDMLEIAIFKLGEGGHQIKIGEVNLLI